MINNATIVVSSLVLATKLSEIDFEKDAVERVNMDEGYFIVITNTKTIKVPCIIVKFKASMENKKPRWDWVKGLVKSCPEQPVLLDISPASVQVIFQY